MPRAAFADAAAAAIFAEAFAFSISRRRFATLRHAASPPSAFAMPFAPPSPLFSLIFFRYA